MEQAEWQQALPIVESLHEDLARIKAQYEWISKIDLEVVARLEELRALAPTQKYLDGIAQQVTVMQQRLKDSEAAAQRQLEEQTHRFETARQHRDEQLQRLNVEFTHKTQEHQQVLQRLATEQTDAEKVARAAIRRFAEQQRQAAVAHGEWMAEKERERESLQQQIDTIKAQMRQLTQHLQGATT